MARVAIVSYDVQTIFGKAGGVAAFGTRLAMLLQQAGDTVTIVMTRTDWEPMRVDPEWRARYQALGIGLIELQSPPPLATRWPEVAPMRVGEMAAPVLQGFDVVYFQDWGNTAFPLVRERRFALDKGPVCITVLHGPSEWELASNHKYPKLPDDLHLAFVERFAAEHCDFVVSPSRYMVGQLTELGWKFPGEVETLGLPMPAPVVGEAPKSAGKIRRIVYFGRVEERKGIRNFVQALQILAPQLENKPAAVLLGRTDEPSLLEFALKGIRQAGFSVSHEASLDSEQAMAYLRAAATEILCVVPSPADNHPYAVVEASMIPGLNLIACNGGGVPEILGHAAAQIAEPRPRDLAAKIAERLEKPLEASEIAQYDCVQANQRWLDFHQRAVAFGAARKALPAVAADHVRPTVDVCITYYQKAHYLPQLMAALEHQTETDFHVIAVNDGSPDEASNAAFEAEAAKVKARGWDFYRQENAFVDAARNSAARRGTGEFILFVDADDVPAHNAVARLREAIVRSGDDLLIPATYFFASQGPPADPVTGEVRVPPFATCIPLGMDLVGGLVDPSCFGGSMFLIRRSVFETMKGFTEMRGVGHEDWEFYVRTRLAGYKVNVLPELLQFYRQVEGSLARSISQDSSKRRLLSAYEDSLRPLGLEGAALALEGLTRTANKLEQRIAELNARASTPSDRYAFFSGITQRFETDSNGVGGLRQWYRERISMETRLKLHRMLLAPFVGDYKPERPKPPSA
jgi:glycosyltransferase involved in cell wall biosynthesis/GT2 family glycosyltransferase